MVGNFSPPQSRRGPAGYSQWLGGGLGGAVLSGAGVLGSTLPQERGSRPLSQPGALACSSVKWRCYHLSHLPCSSATALRMA